MSFGGALSLDHNGCLSLYSVVDALFLLFGAMIKLMKTNV